MKEIQISKEACNQRVDKYVRKMLNDAPLSFIYKLFRKKDVKINGRWVTIDYILQTDDVLRVYITDAQLEEFNNPRPVKDVKLTHEIIYEDDNILLINKPKGLLVHGDEKEKRLTLTNQVLNYLFSTGVYDPKRDVGFTPAPAHRLDRNTSGIVVFGKNIQALQQLLQLFKNKNQIEKHYLTLVAGILKGEGKIDFPLKKDAESGLVTVAHNERDGQEALTLFSAKEQLQGFTLLDVQIITGRTHQIRAHMLAINHPVVGDGKYGDFNTNKFFKVNFKYETQFLHADRIVFKTINGPLSYLSGKTFTAKLGKKEQEILSALRK